MSNKKTEEHELKIVKAKEMIQNLLQSAKQNMNTSSDEIMNNIALIYKQIDQPEKAILQKEHDKLQSELDTQNKHLKESEEKYHSIFESSRDAMMLLAPPTWKFISGNPSTIKMFRTKDEDEFVSCEPWKLSPKHQPDAQLSSDKAKAMIQKAMLDGSNFFEWTHKRVSGEEFPATVLLSRIKIGGEDLLQATVRDISDRKKAEQELIDYQKKLEDMVVERTAKVSDSYERFMRETDERKIAEKKVQMLSEVFRKFGSDPKENIDIILKQTCEILEGVCSLYNRLDKEEKSLEVWSSHNAPADLNLKDHPKGHICYEATIKGKDRIVSLGDLRGTEYEKTDVNVKKYGLRSYLGFPVSLRNKSIGALCIVDTKPRNYNPTEMYIITTLAKAISIEEERLAVDSNLNESEERYRAIVENSHDAIYIYQNNKFKFVSNKLSKLSGYDLDIIYKMEVWDLIHSDDKERIQSYGKDRLLGKKVPETYAAKVVCKNGDIRNCEFAVSVTTFENDHAILGSVRDVTEKKQAELEVKASEKKFSGLFKGMSAGVVFCKAIYNSKGIMKDCIYEDMNPAYEGFTKLRKKDAVGKKVSEMLPGTSVRWFEIFTETSVTAKSKQFEMFHKPTNKFYSVSAYSTKKGYFTAVLEDLSSKKTAEENLRKNKEAYQNIFDNSPVGISSFDKTGKVLEVNKELLKILGSDSGEATRSINILKFPPLVEVGFAYDFEQCMRSEKTIINERNYTSKWGKQVYLRYILAPIHNDIHEVTGVQGIFEDVTGRMNIEKELKKTKEKYEVLFKDAPNSILLIDSKGIILDCNKAECEMIGYEYDEICGKHATSFFKEEYIPMFKKMFPTLTKSGNAELELELVHKNGNSFPVWRTANAIFDSRNKFSGAIIHTTDISVLKKAEAELQIQKDYYSDFVELLTDWVWEMDLNGIHTYSNKAVKDFLGYEPEELVGESAVEFWSSISERSLQNFEAALAAGKGWINVESMFRHKNGSKVFVESSGIPIFDEEGKLSGYRGVDHNITKRRKARDLLQKSEERYRMLADHSTDIISLWINNEPVYFSPAIKRLMGFDPEYLLKNYIKYIHPDDLKTHLKLVEENTTKKQKHSSHIDRYKIKNGKYVYIETIFENTYEDDGKIISIGVSRDITDSMETRKKLERSELKLKRTNLTLNKRVETEIKKGQERNKIMLVQSRQAALGEMIGNIAHQWRQPLNALGLSFQELQDAYEHNEFSKQKLDDIVSLAMVKIKYMSQTIEDFRTFFKPMGVKEKFSVRVAIESALRLVEEEYLNKGINISVSFSEKLYIHGYKNEFAQVILNIVNNSKDALMHNRINNPEIRISLKHQNKYAVVELADNGGGIPEEIIDRIFDPYFSTKAKTEGTGIGLYMSKMIIEKNMGGKFLVKSTNSGAKFIIKIKLYKGNEVIKRYHEKN